MKKTFCYILTAALLIATLGGCGGNSQESSAPAAGTSNASSDEATAAESAGAETSGGELAVTETTHVTIGTSGTGGTLAILGTAIASVVNEANPNIVVNVENTPSGGAGNVLAIGTQDIEFGLATADGAYEGYLGLGTYTEKIEDIRMIATGLPFSMHVITLASSPLQTIEDIKGKNVAGVGSAGTRQASDMLAVCGLTAEDYNITTYTLGEACDALKDGAVDAVVTFTSAPAANILDLTSSAEIRFLDVAPYQEKILEEYSFCVPATIPAGVYDGQEEELVTIAYPVTLFTGAYVSDAVVYEVTKAIMENNEKLVTIYENAGYFSPENQKENLSADIVPPIHDGALKYYQEKGLLP
ncbi:TAXI family TRAP transporter solute-binding subunit [Hominifimenecus sp. rT4P-3]|uniref:TAXI family TRAP transporter solute-binding subunit n=1 Tax=Hominifimenecus sp. rT4P-3 TaxID=3242979 RepID=UPI003DA3A4A3